MSLKILAFARFAVVLATAIVAVPLAGAPALEAFGHLPSVDHIAVSPDGKAVALIVGNEHQRQLQIRDTIDLHIISVVAVGQAKIRGLSWGGDNHVLIAASQTAVVLGLTGPKHEYLGLVDCNIAGKKTRRLLEGEVDGVPRKLNTAAAIPVVRMIGGKPVAFIEGWSFPESHSVLTMFRVDLDTGRTRLVSVGNADTIGWMVDDAGAISARVDYGQANGEWTLVTRHDGRLVKSISMVRPLDPPEVRGVGRTPNTVLVGVPGDERIAYHEVALGDDHLSEPIAALAGGRPIHDGKTGQVIGVEREDGLAVAYTFFDPADAKVWTMVGKAFPKAVVTLASWSDDRRKIVLKVEGKDAGAAYYLLDVARHHAGWIADEYAEVAPTDVAERLAISYPAADGLPIPAYLTLPPGRTPKNLPLVVLPHGGPGARDEAGFDWWSQALASRGYAVLQPEFRGSTGFGAKFHAAGYGEWGKKMQTDLSDGVKYLAGAGTVDAKRVCIVGASYGGYAALAGVALQSGIYRCAVSLAGPADLRAMLSWERPDGGRDTETIRFWKRFMGAKSSSDPALDTISPAKFAAKVDVPVLLIHGADDTVVPFAQSKIMASALTRAGKHVEFVILKREDHWLSRSETRTEMLLATGRFLAANLPVDPAAPVAASRLTPGGR